MSPFDLSVLFFFASITAKALYDSYHFWHDEETVQHKVRPAHIPPKHLPAPTRPSPSHIAVNRAPRKKAIVEPINRPARRRTVA